MAWYLIKHRDNFSMTFHMYLIIYHVKLIHFLCIVLKGIPFWTPFVLLFA